MSKSCLDCSMRFYVLILVQLFACSFSAGQELLPGAPAHPGLHRPASFHFQFLNPADFSVAEPENWIPLEQLNHSDLKYHLATSPEKAFNNYLKINPFEVWDGKSGLLKTVFLPSTNCAYQKDDFQHHWKGVEVGMKLFINMAILPLPVSNNPSTLVCMEITEVNYRSKTVIFRYLQGTPSFGVQRVDFQSSQSDPKTTLIRHRTWFGSYKKSVALAYPSYHRKLINRMHRRYREIIK